MADLVRRALTIEGLMWASLGRWVLRRPDVPAGAAAFRYAGPVTPILWTFVVLSAIETVALHLVLPWEVVRLVVDVVSVYGLVWMMGLVAAHRVRPHVVGERGLRLRDSLFADVFVPWEDVAAVRRRRGLVAGGKWDGAVLRLAVSGQADLEVTLCRPVALAGGAAEAVRFHADDAAGMERAIRERLASDRIIG